MYRLSTEERRGLAAIAARFIARHEPELLERLYRTLREDEALELRQTAQRQSAEHYTATMHAFAQAFGKLFAEQARQALRDEEAEGRKEMLAALRQRRDAGENP